MMPERVKREKGMKLLFECFVRHAIAKGRVYATSGNFEGVMALLPPESVKVRTWNLFIHGGWKILAKLGLGFLARQAPYSSASDRIRENHAPAGHWLLWHIAVDPAKQ
ncbi:MAG: hypothetical protein Q6373_012265 [Candidatus Sigynarchaeota archaeon]